MSTMRDFHEVLPEGHPPLRTEKIVCPQCRGTGGSSAYLGSFTTEELREDPDFAEDYMAGRYDRTCDTCHGQNVIDDVDRDRSDPATLALWDEWCQEEADYRHMCEMERRMGA